jgi:hypothetical protein
MRKMDRDDELSLLRKRKAELDTISNNLHDIKKWFEDNELKLSGCAHDLLSEIESAIDRVGDASFECDCLLVKVELVATVLDPRGETDK